MSDPDPVAAAWLSEMWRTCRELPYGERMEKRVQDAVSQALLHSQAPVEDEPGIVDRGAA